MGQYIDHDAKSECLVGYIAARLKLFGPTISIYCSNNTDTHTYLFAIVVSVLVLAGCLLRVSY